MYENLLERITTSETLEDMKLCLIDCLILVAETKKMSEKSNEDMHDLKEFLKGLFKGFCDGMSEIRRVHSRI